jgi:PilZ domain
LCSQSDFRTIGWAGGADTMENKRSDPRVPLIAAAEVTEVSSGTRLSARTSDLSRTGCYVDTLNPTPAKTIVRVRLSHAGEELDLPGRIVYTSPGLGMGVRFDDDLSAAQLAVLDRWVSEAG